MHAKRLQNWIQMKLFILLCFPRTSLSFRDWINAVEKNKHGAAKWWHLHRDFHELLSLGIPEAVSQLISFVFEISCFFEETWSHNKRRSPYLTCHFWSRRQRASSPPETSNGFLTKDALGSLFLWTFSRPKRISSLLSSLYISKWI